MSYSFKPLKQTLLKAAQLTRGGHLMDATRLIQEALSGGPASAVAGASAHTMPTAPVAARAANDDSNVIDVEVVEVKQPTATQPDAPVQEPRAEPVVAPADVSRPAAGRFIADQFVYDGATYPYRLYVPALSTPENQTTTAMPLVVLLHGCTQNAADFAAGTAMNGLADTHGCMVLYPQQITSGNAQMCWNWFEPAHQAVGRGEPGMIAALTQHILTQPVGHYTAGATADPSRVYIAGLSAGGAMAAVVAARYPGLFAALGVHSGLASGAATSMMSAFKAMGTGAAGTGAAALPTIVFHGTADGTVNPANGDSIAQAAVKAIEAVTGHGIPGLKLVATQDRPVKGHGEKSASRTVYRDASGTPLVEQWSVAAGPHAWSGGDAAGSYTDPAGPSASEAMLSFFLQHSTTR